ncbi:hypothetical protein MPLA_250056 [Mesorhizobium sp. ORS 3359]|nr:hypothetical protein MPLA_250056 [Mesorhizobium sp. ORS 3359]
MPDQAHAEGTVAGVPVHAGAVVGNFNDEVPVRLAHLDADAAGRRLVLEGMLQRVGDEFVHDQRHRRCLVGGNDDRLQVEFRTDLRPTGCGKQIRDEVPGEIGDIELAYILRLVESAMDGAQRFYAFQHRREGVLDGLILDHAALHQDQGRDHLKIVLHPVVDLMEQRGLRLERSFELPCPFLHRLFKALLVGYDALLGMLAVGDIQLRGEEKQKLAFVIVDRADVERVPEGGTVLAIVQKVDADVVALGHRRAKFRDGSRIRLRSLQEAAVPAHDLFARIARQPKERIIDEDDRVVRFARIGDKHRHARCPNGRREWVAFAMLDMKTVSHVPGVWCFPCMFPVH